MDVHYEFIHYEFVRLLSPSSFEVESDGRQAKNTSLDRLCIYSRPVRSHVTNLRGGTRGPKP